MESSAGVTWTVEFHDFEAVEKALKRLTVTQLAEAVIGLKTDLEVFGIDLFEFASARWLGGGLAEYRHRRSPDVLVRFFFCFRDGKCIVVLSAYDKKRSPSKNRQQLEIANARKIMKTL